MPRHEISLALVIPALAARMTAAEIAASDLPELPALQRLLDRADAGTGTLADKDLSAGLSASFGIGSAGGDPPVAALTALADGMISTAADREACWLRADPVNLHPDVDRLILFEAQRFPLSQDEADACVELLNEAFSQDGLRFAAPVPERWYLRLEQPPAITTSPPAAVAGQDIHAAMPAGQDCRKWRALMNEIQMLLHDSPINLQREARGLPALNSVWFWGAGVLPAFAASKVMYAAVYTDDSLLRGLASHAGARLSGAPADFETWWQQRPVAGESIVMLDSGAVAARYGESQAWIEALRQLEMRWFAPLLAALGSGRLGAVTLLPGDGRTFLVTRGRLRRFWRRRGSLISCLTS